MSSTVCPTLHRFVPRGAIETSEYGYEVLSGGSTVDAVLATIEWIDCWCPDAAQFVLVDAPAALTALSCSRLLDAVEASQFRSKLRLVCKASTLSDQSVVATMMKRGMGLLLDDAVDDLECASRVGVVGIRIGPARLADLLAGAGASSLRDTLNAARDVSLRCIASQAPRQVDEQLLFASGFDYVSQPGRGISPLDVGAWFRQKAAK